jgi:hypothetical protein
LKENAVDLFAVASVLKGRFKEIFFGVFDGFWQAAARISDRISSPGRMA